MEMMKLRIELKMKMKVFLFYQQKHKWKGVGWFNKVIEKGRREENEYVYRNILRIRRYFCECKK